MFGLASLLGLLFLV